MWLECTSENWITVNITKCSRKTIPHNRTANRKCTLPEVSSCASYGGGSGSWRSEGTSLWACRVKCYQVSEIGRTTFIDRRTSDSCLRQSLKTFLYGLWECPFNCCLLLTNLHLILTYFVHRRRIWWCIFMTSRCVRCSAGICIHRVSVRDARHGDGHEPCDNRSGSSNQLSLL